ncbi:MAG: hypothetical protein U1F61_24205 [Opitutaceae bacterium]
MRMKLTNLLASRQTLQRQVHLANLAYCFRTFSELARRIEQARLRGPVLLSQVNAAEDRYWPTLVSLDGRQAMIEEHFDDDDILLLCDGIAFAIAGEFSDLQFDLSEMTGRFVAPLRRALLKEGVELDLESSAYSVDSRTQDSNQDAIKE